MLWNTDCGNLVISISQQICTNLVLMFLLVIVNYKTKNHSVVKWFLLFNRDVKAVFYFLIYVGIRYNRAPKRSVFVLAKQGR